MLVKSTTILEGYSDEEKGAYLGAIASLATADRTATMEEIDHLESLAEAAVLSSSQREAVVRAAIELSGDELKKCLEILKKSDLRFSLVADLISFAEVDNDYSDEERKDIEKIIEHLDVNKTQFSLLDQFVQRTAQSNKSTEEMTKPGFLESLGLKDQFKKAGINIGSAKGILGFLGPMLLGGMLSRGFRSSGLGNNFDNTRAIKGSGGSIFSALNSRRIKPDIGTLLSRIFR